MNPIKTADDIKKTYQRYLMTRFPLGKTVPSLREVFFNLLDNKIESLIKGPIIEITPPYVKGKTLRKLDNYWKPLIKHLDSINKSNLCDMSLYKHQEEALQMSIDNNLIVATGTGSGKTEAFLYPIINYCLINKSCGVQAILVYPLNALVEDQIKRIASLLKNSNITFGKYTGQTPRRKIDAQRENEKKECKNHIITREEMRENPPNILITNYTMLEYMLLRPGDSPIIDKQDDFTFRFIILDEAHTYSGAQGTEVAFLLQRLRARVNRKPEDIRYIATSATLGKGKKVLKKTVTFASRLFGSHFTEKNIIKGKKQDIFSQLSSETTNYLNINNLLKWGVPSVESEKSKLLEYIKDIWKKEIKESEIHSLFRKERIIKKIIENLQEEPKDIKQLSEIVFESDNFSLEEKEKALVNLISWSSFVTDIDKIPILPSRYHMFISGSKGIYCKLSNSQNNKWDFLALNQKEIDNSGGYPFELGVCKVCGKPYIIGAIIVIDGKEYYKPIADSYFESIDSPEEYKSKVIFSFDNIEGSTPVKICTKCGNVNNKCNHPNDFLVELFRVYNNPNYFNNDDEILEETAIDEIEKRLRCSCGYGKSIDKSIILFRFNENGSTAPLVSTLFKNAPHFKQKDLIKFNKEIIEENGNFKNYSPIISNGKKILLFSDSRQKAAYYGPYLQVTHNQILFNKFVVNIIRKLKQPISIEELVEKVANRLSYNADNNILTSLLLKELNPTDFKNERATKTILKQRVYFSIINLIDRTATAISGIEGLGFGAIYYNDFSFFEKINLEGISTKQLISLSHLVLRYIRQRQAFLQNYENGEIRLKDDDIYFDSIFDIPILLNPEENSRHANKVRLILQNNKMNALQEMILKFLKSQNINSDLTKVNEIIIRITSGLINGILINNNGNGYKLDVSLLSIMPVNNIGNFVKTIPGGYNKFKTCKICGRLSWIDIGGICNFSGCNGELTDEDISIQTSDEFNHYRYLYSANSFKDDLRAVEHTAQLNKNEAAKEYQKEFKRGRLNILSCSTTFEMGIDLGDLSIVFMRNVPPSIANYVQRAGRAGRRVGVSPFVVTYCRNIPHDQFYFKNVLQLVNGEVNPPTIVLENEKILQRHFNAVILSDFFKQNREAFTPMKWNYIQDLKMKNLFESNIIDSQECIPFEYFKNDWFPKLINHYSKQLNSIFKTFITHSFVNNTIKKYFAQNEIIKNKKYGLSYFYEDYRSVINELERIKNDLINNEEYEKIKSISDTIKSKKNEQLISFLSSHGNLPSYAFPNNVVPLKILSKSDHKKTIDLNRNLEIAISEYAPGSDVIANAKVYKSTSLYKFKSQDFPIYYYAKCNICSWFQSISANKKNSKEKINQLVNKHRESTGHDNFTRKKAIIPKWGFAVDRNKSNSKWIKRGTKIDRAGYSSELLVNDTAFDKSKEIEILFENASFNIQYANGYDVCRINEGRKYQDTNRNGFRICLKCGQITKERNRTTNHKTPFGGNCDVRNREINNYSLLSIFDTDLIKISIRDCPQIPLSVNSQYLSKSFWRTLLYAFIEGCSKVLEVDRNDLDGVYKLHTNDEFADIIILDSVSGGAGHIARLIGKGGENPETLFKEILAEVKNVLNCSECIAACYSCLFHYSNQSVQHSLNRIPVLEWINTIII